MRSRPIRPGVLVVEIALARDELPADRVELAGQLDVPGEVHRRRRERAVARPHVRVRVAVEAQDVGVVPGEDRAALVGLGAEDEARRLVLVAEVVGEDLREVRLVLVRPQAPVVLGPLDERDVAAVADELVDGANVVVCLSRGDPERDRRGPEGGEAHVDLADGVDRALGDGVAREDAVLGVAPRADIRAGLLATDRKGGQADRALAAARVQEEVAARLVVDEGARARVVVSRVADVVPVEVALEVVEQADVALVAGRVLDRDLLEV